MKNTRKIFLRKIWGAGGAREPQKKWRGGAGAQGGGGGGRGSARRKKKPSVLILLPRVCHSQITKTTKKESFLPKRRGFGDDFLV